MSISPKDIPTIFGEALEIASTAERELYLNQICAGDAKLRRRVDQLLEDHARAGDFLERTSGLDLLMRSTGTERPGTLIGPYKLLEPIGEGGFGMVFLAEQIQPVQRQVALKIIKPGMDARQVIARFEAERQALALMEHPNIARVLDAGATESGRPYFVMELVKGSPITEYCDQCLLTPRQRLALMVDVCHAIQHAHQKGIIHRDLKPSNVLVTQQDGKSVVKVIDFGIAKSTGRQLSHLTQCTADGQFIGTPLYMSPEQAEGASDDIDTRTDVYSLGVLLYEMLTSTLPFSREPLIQVNFDELRRMIREDEPQRPSDRVSTLLAATRSTIAARRGVEPRKLSQQLRGELDWIVMKCLEKERSRRYESAGAFADDIERYLQHQPVQARAPSTWYVLRKFVRRNRVRLGVTGLVATLVLLLAIGAGRQAFERAARQTETTTAVAKLLEETAQYERQSEWRRALETARRAKKVVESVDRAESMQADIQQRVANLEWALRLEEIRIVNGELMTPAERSRAYANSFLAHGIDVESQSAAEIAQRLPAMGPIRTQLVAALDNWAKVCWRNSDKEGEKRLLQIAMAADPDPWRSQLRAAIRIRDFKALKELQASPPLENPIHPSEIILLDWLILNKQVWNLFLEAQRRSPNDFWLNFALARHFSQENPPQFDEALGFYRAAAAVRPESPDALTNMGNVLRNLKRYEEAIATHKQVVRMWPEFAPGYSSLGTSLFEQGEMAEAIAAHRRAVALRPDVGIYHYNLGTVLYHTGDFAEAVTCLREAARIHPTDASAFNNLGNALKQIGDWDAAEEAFRSAIRLRPRVAQAYNGLGGLLCDQRDDLEGARTAFQRAIELQPGNATFHVNLGNVFSRLGKLEEASTSYRTALAIDANDVSTLSSLGEVLIKQGELKAALSTIQKVLQLRPDHEVAHNMLGNIRAALGELDLAIIAYRTAIRLKPDEFRFHLNLCTAFMRIMDWDQAIAAATEALRYNPELPEAYCNRGVALREKGRLAEALESLKRGHELGSKQPNWSYPSARWVSECQQLIEREAKKDREIDGGKL